MEFSNMSATGIFDGVVPMIFDERGGQIDGGRLEARPPGGTLSYIGAVSDQDLGAYGKLAFDALKSLRYDRFIIALDGELAGEFLTQIELDGIATNTEPLRSEAHTSELQYLMRISYAVFCLKKKT